MSNWSEKDLLDVLERRGVPAAHKPVDVSNPPFKPPHNPAGRYARGRRRPPGEMNKTETAYAAHLEAKKNAGMIHWYAFEAMKLKLADNTTYTPDFAVLADDDVLEFHEVKGFWEDDARVKIKVAAALFPFRFIAVKANPKRDGGGWKREHF